MKQEIKGYGYEYSFSKFMKTTLLILSGIVFAGYMYQLHWGYVLLILATAILTLPMIIRTQYRYLYEQQRFTDATTYMEQMIYMFKKKPQVLYALRETKDILSKDARACCERVIAKLEEGRYEENLYVESFQEIEKEYGCERMYILHRFLFRVEAEGGIYQDSMNLLLDDLKGWIQRIYQFQKERKKIKTNVTISIIATLVICLFTTKIFPAEYSIASKTIYQITTTIMMLLMIGVYAWVQSKLSGAWLTDYRRTKEEIERDYYKALSPGRGNKPPTLFMVAMIVAMIYGIIVQDWLILVAGLLGGIILWRQPKRSKRAAMKRYEREVRKDFPNWLRELTLILQRKPVSAAIIESISYAPHSMQIPLKKMEKEFETDLVSIEPYQNFLSEFELREISSAMKMLYAMNTSGREDMLGQIHALLERNSKLQEKSEELQEKDRLALCGFLVVLPMIFSFIKLVTDMLLLISGFLSRFSSVI